MTTARELVDRALAIATLDREYRTVDDRRKMGQLLTEALEKLDGPPIDPDMAAAFPAKAEELHEALMKHVKVAGNLSHEYYEGRASAVAESIVTTLGITPEYVAALRDPYQRGEGVCRLSADALEALLEVATNG